MGCITVNFRFALRKPEPEPEFVCSIASRVAQVYIKLQQGECARFNGQPEAPVIAGSSFATLQQAPGHYTFTISSLGGIREQALDISDKGVWLPAPD